MSGARSRAPGTVRGGTVRGSTFASGRLRQNSGAVPPTVPSLPPAWPCACATVLLLTSLLTTIPSPDGASGEFGAVPTTSQGSPSGPPMPATDPVDLPAPRRGPGARRALPTLHRRCRRRTATPCRLRGGAVQCSCQVGGAHACGGNGGNQGLANVRCGGAGGGRRATCSMAPQTAENVRTGPCGRPSRDGRHRRLLPPATSRFLLRAAGSEETLNRGSWRTSQASLPVARRCLRPR
jgi:hypothetical protein